MMVYVANVIFRIFCLSIVSILEMSDLISAFWYQRMWLWDFMINEHLLRIPLHKLAGCDFLGSWKVKIVLSCWNIHWVFLFNMTLLNLLLNRVISSLDINLNVAHLGFFFYLFSKVSIKRYPDVRSCSESINWFPLF